MNKTVETVIKGLEVQVEYAMYKPQRDALQEMLDQLRGITSKTVTPDYNRQGEIFFLGWRERNVGDGINWTKHTYNPYSGKTYRGYVASRIAQGKNGGGSYVGYHKEGMNVKSSDGTRGKRVGKSGYRGVTVRDGKYAAQRYVNGEKKYLGVFDCPIEAHNAYLAAKTGV